MSTLLLRNGRVIDPSRDFDSVADLWLADGKILGTGPQSRTADKTLDCTGLIVSPGLIDMHVHLREPGREEDETIATGTAAAVAGCDSEDILNHSRGPGPHVRGCWVVDLVLDKS